jgi:hypothetical protein
VTFTSDATNFLTSPDISTPMVARGDGVRRVTALGADNSYFDLFVRKE